jgi:hypothetical protein
MEFFTPKELTMQIGQHTRGWPIALVKELIDNGLDACEKAGVSPVLCVAIEPDAVSVVDNGPGLPEEVLRRSLDYTLRISDNSHYVSPTRGQLGNALKCIWAAPFVADGRHGRVEVVTGGQRHVIDVSLDRIKQEPQLQLLQSEALEDGSGKIGTLLRMHWPRVAGYLLGSEGHGFYQADRLLAAYAALNPHARFELTVDGEGRVVYEPSLPTWKKWIPSWPTNIHWYTFERLRGLIAAKIAEERGGAKVQTVRDFLLEFDGLSSNRIRKEILEKAKLTRTSLQDLVSADDVDAAAVERLLAAMRSAARPVKGKTLGVIGEPHLGASLIRMGIDPDSILCRKVVGEADGLPFVLEVAFGIHDTGCGRTREAIAGVNWSPALDAPFRQLPSLLGEARVDPFDCATILVHLACPRPEFLNRGKGHLVLPPDIEVALKKCVRLVTQQWHDAKRRADREDRLSEVELERLRKARRPKLMTIKDAAYQVMEAAYRHASGGSSYPANARQIMYAARPLVLELTGGKFCKNSSTFTQSLLPDFVSEHPDITAGWDVVYDARGHLAEPHTGRSFGLGTLEVRGYTASWTAACPDGLGTVTLPHAFPTSGPANRYTFALFVEKEGFGPLLERARIRERFDVAIMSTKGMSVTASRELVDDLSQQGVAILVLHDFDAAGFFIVNSMRTDSRRYTYREPPKIIDIGLRLDDVRAMSLASEPVSYQAKKDPRKRLRECGATKEECDFLVRGGGAGGWHGQRVELNTMASPQFIAFVERKFAEAGVGKVVPRGDVLGDAYRRACRIAQAQAAIDRAVAELRDAELPEAPPDLAEQLARAVEGTDLAWDEALWMMVRQPITRGLERINQANGPNGKCGSKHPRRRK